VVPRAQMPAGPASRTRRLGGRFESSSLPESGEGERGVAFGSRDTEDAEAEVWREEIAAGVKVSALGAATTGKGKVDCRLRRPIPVGFLLPGASEAEVLVEIEGKPCALRVSLKCSAHGVALLRVPDPGLVAAPARRCDNHRRDLGRVNHSRKHTKRLPDERWAP
jgi:hypothetical protein